MKALTRQPPRSSAGTPAVSRTTHDTALTPGARDPSGWPERYPPVAWAVGTIAAAVVYTWLFNNTGGSVLLVVVFHALGNTVGRLAPNPTADVVPDAIIKTLVAVGIVFGAAHLSHRRHGTLPRGVAGRTPTSTGARQDDAATAQPTG